MKLFTPAKLGPVELRNRTIRSAAFEGMGRDNGPTDMLLVLMHSAFRWHTGPF